MILKNEDELKKELKLGQLRPVYLLYGNENLLKAHYLKGILSLLLPDRDDGLDRIDGKKFDVRLLCESARQPALLGGNRVLLVDDLDAEALSEAEMTLLCGLCGELPPETFLVMVVRGAAFDPKKSKPKKLIAAAGAAGVCCALDARKGAELKRFVRAAVQKRGCSISADNAALLIERCAGDMGVLAGEIEKLCAYRRKGEVTAELICRVSSQTVQGDLYAVARRIVKGDADGAIHEIGALLAEKQTPAAIVANLSYAFSDLCRAQAARAAGLDSADVVKDFGYRFAFRVSNAFRDSAALDPRRLYTAAGVLLDAELTLKSASVDERTLLEGAVLQMIAALRGEALSAGRG